MRAYTVEGKFCAISQFHEVPGTNVTFKNTEGLM
jgi:hypothetical protein